MDLYGRDAERGELDGLLERARQARSAVLVLRAEAGMGKSALLEYAGDRAAGLRVLRTSGVEPEADLPYAALHRLAAPVLPLLDRIPPVQAAALRGALAIGPATGPNRFAVALAVLNLLAEAAADGPVLCLVDDAQWLDGPTADALAFAGRRLDAEGVVLLFAVRDGDPRTFDGTGLPERPLTGLGDDAADALLRRRFGRAIAADVRRAVRLAAQGNPLALLEIPAVLSGDQLAGHQPLPEPMPLGTELERILLGQVHRLGPPAQSLLLVAAAEQDAGVVLEAAERLGIDESALAEAEEAGLIRRSSGELVFRHPILRTAVYQSARPALRRSAHRALAEVLWGDRDADRRARHRAALAGRQDDVVADELEKTAGRARRRGGHAAASAALHRAAELSSDTETRARRLTGAAQAAWDAPES